MMSYGSRVATLKREVIDYITRQVKDHKAYKNKPGDLLLTNGYCYVVEEKVGNMRLENCSIERLTCIADRIHFQPLGELIKRESGGRSTLSPKNETIETKTENMNFEIKKDIPVPTKAVRGRKVSSVTKRGKNFNYRALPLKNMKVGECIVIFENCIPEEVMRKVYTARIGIKSFVNLMDTQKKFYVDKAGDNKVCVWRLE